MVGFDFFFGLGDSVGDWWVFWFVRLWCRWVGVGLWADWLVGFVGAVVVPIIARYLCVSQEYRRYIQRQSAPAAPRLICAK